MRPALPLTLILAALMLPATMTVQAQDETADETIIATVNGTDYDLDLFRAFYAQRLRETNGQNTPQFQEQAFNEFLSVIVAAQEGEKRKVTDEADVQTALELQRLMTLSNAAMRSIGQDEPPTDKELKKAYEEFKEQAQRTEYKARHILVDDKEKAESLIKQLDKSGGKDFEKLARENSLGPTADKGGDLGWFDARRMVKPFAEAIAELKPGSYTEQPVQTQFGWHVILLEETRDAEPPSFEEAKPNLEAVVRQRNIAEALGQLRENAKIELNEDVVKVKEEGDGEQ